MNGLNEINNVLFYNTYGYEACINDSTMMGEGKRSILL